MAEDAAGAEYVRLEERLPENLEEWKAAALRHAIGQHGMLIRRDALAEFDWRDLFALLCQNRYRAAADCADGAPAGTEYVVCTSHAEAAQCFPNANQDVTPLLNFQLCNDYSSKRQPWFECLRRVAFAFVDSVIGECFLSDVPNLEYVDFRGVRGVTSIGSNFLSCSLTSDIVSRLRELDLSPFRGVIAIDSSFLEGSGIRSLDLRPLYAITRIPLSFLERCVQLEYLDFYPMTNVTNIGNFFLLNCPKLHACCPYLGAVNLRGLERVRRVDFGFLDHCSALRTLNLAPLRSLQSIDGRFLRHCCNLEEVRFDALRNVHRLDKYEILWGCPRLSPESVESADEFRARISRLKKEEKERRAPRQTNSDARRGSRGRGSGIGHRGRAGGAYQREYPSSNRRDPVDRGGRCEPHRQQATGLCCFYLRGFCKFGDRCRYSHADDGRRGCHFGSSCRVGHQSRGSIDGS